MIDPRKLGQLLLGEWNKTEQPLKERGSVLPIGEYEDGSVGLAWPALLNTPYEALRKFGSHGYGEDAVPYNARQAFDAAGLAMTGGLGVGLAGGMVDNALGSAGGKLTQSASDLPMDLASRMQRARDMGFDTDRVLYHGASGQDFSEFRPSRSGEFGPGSYFSTEPKEASAYAMSQHAGDNPRVIPAHTRANLLKVSSPDEFWGRFGGDAVTDEQAIQAAIEAGYGGVEFTRPLTYWDDAQKRIVDTGEIQTHVNVFDPRNIRSVNAAFDPSKADSANLLAANAPTGAVGPLATQTQDDTDIEPALLDYLRLIGLY